MHVRDFEKNPRIQYLTEVDLEPATRAVVCVIRGQINGVVELLDNGFDAEGTFNVRWIWEQNIMDSHERAWCWDAEAHDLTTLMHVAARYNQMEIIRLLIQRGTTIDCVAVSSDIEACCHTPLSEAANFGHLDMVRLLLDAGARADYAIRNSQGGCITISSDLLRRALDPRRRGLPDLGQATTICWKDRREIFDLLMKHGAEASFAEPGANGPTMEMAVRFNQLDLAHELLRRGVSCVTTLKAFVCNPTPDEALLNLLVDNGAANVEDALDAVQVDGLARWERFHPTHVSPQEWKYTTSRNRQRAMSLILQHPRFKTFTKTQSATEMMTTAAFIQDVTLMKVLISNGLSIDCVDSDGRSPIHLASMCEPTHALQWLVTNGVDLTKQVDPPGPYSPLASTGDTALHIAAANQLPTSVELLLHAGADVHASANWCDTPLLKLCRRLMDHTDGDIDGPVKSLKALLHAGSDVHARDSYGMNALHLMIFDIRNSDVEHGPESSGPVIQLLIDYGIDPLKEDGCGKLAVQYAIEKGQDEACPLRRALENCTPDYPLVIKAMGL